MSFSCHCDVDSANFSSVSMHRARKEYQCGECRQSIKIGDTYERTFSVYDGIAHTDFSCERCSDLAASFSELGFCWDIGDLISSYADWLESEGKPKPKWLTDL